MIKFNPELASTGGDFGVIPAGDYECIIESGAVKTASTGTEYIDFQLKIRDDVQGQQYGGRVLWGKLFNTENTQGILHGFLANIDTPRDKEFASMEELKNFAVGKAIIARVKITQYNGADRNEVAYMNKSKVGGGKVEDPFDNTPVDVAVAEDLLPF